jgi:plasmid stabilization system protein ParE
MPEVTFLPAAAEEYAAASDWYWSHSELAATQFELAIEHALTEIAAGPEHWPRCDRRHRRFVLQRYPYSIVYRVHEATIIVVAVAHTRRRPGYWKSTK